MNYNLEKITQKISKDSNGCWNWLGSIDHHGKCRLKVKGKYLTIVRELYQMQHKIELTRSDLLIRNEGCSNATCVNPNHFNKTTKKEYAQSKEIPIKDRLMSNVVIQDNECWEWQLGLHRDGYGLIRYRGRDYKAHRLSFEVFKHAITKPVIMHSCDNPKCINPDHLSEGTQLENMQDCVSKGRLNRRSFE